MANHIIIDSRKSNQNSDYFWPEMRRCNIKTAYAWVLQGKIPDHVPVCPDISNMIPARLTGKPFWDIYVHEDPPLWKAYIDASNYFDIDSGFELYAFGDLFQDLPTCESRIVKKYEDGRKFGSKNRS